MVKEESIFTVAEDEKLQEETLHKEAISIDEDDLIAVPMAGPNPICPGPGPMGPGPGPMGPGPIDLVPGKDKEESIDWRVSKQPKHFMVFLTNEMGRIPSTSAARGNKSMMEKALGQYKKLNSHISHALQSDYDDDIDVSKIDEVREVVERAIDELEDALEGISKMTKERKKMRRRRAGEDDNDIMKEATVPHFNGFQMMVTPFQRAIAGALINGKVSGGRNIEELWLSAAKKYKMDDREQLEILQILADMGHPEFKDRLRIGDDEDPTRKDESGEWQSQYYA